MTLNFTLAMGSHFVCNGITQILQRNHFLPIFSDSVAPERPSWKFVTDKNFFRRKNNVGVWKNIFDNEKTLEIVKEIKMKWKKVRACLTIYKFLETSIEYQGYSKHLSIKIGAILVHSQRIRDLRYDYERIWHTQQNVKCC